MNLPDTTKQAKLTPYSMSYLLRLSHSFHSHQVNQECQVSWQISYWITSNTSQASGLILGLRPANEIRRYKVTPSLIG